MSLSHRSVHPKRGGRLCEAFHMSDPVVVVLISVAGALLAALYAVMMWNSRQSARYLVRAAGIILIIAGALATGVTSLLVDGVQALVDWVSEKPLDTLTWAGIAMAGAGVITTVVAGYVKAPTRAEAKQLRAERTAREQAAAKAAAQRQAPAPPPLPKTPDVTIGVPEPSSPPPSFQAPNVPDAGAPEPGIPATSRPSEPQPGASGPATANPDDEVANILRKHDIQ